MLNKNYWAKQIYKFSDKFGPPACHFGNSVSTNEIRVEGNKTIRTKHETTQLNTVWCVHLFHQTRTII